MRTPDNLRAKNILSTNVRAKNISPQHIKRNPRGICRVSKTESVLYPMDKLSQKARNQKKRLEKMIIMLLEKNSKKNNIKIIF